MRRAWWLVPGGLLAGYLAVGAAFVWMQDALIFPAPTVPREALDRRAAELGTRVVELVAEDGVRLYAWHRPAPRPRGAVLFLHGNAETVADRPELHAMVQMAGFDLLVPAYRGYPGSEGAPSEAGLALDAEAAWRWLVETRGFPPERIVVHGKSLGGGVAAGLAAAHPPGALVLESTFTAITDLGRARLPGLPVRPLLRHRFETRERAAAIDVPVLILHGEADELIPIAHARENAARFPRATLIEVPRAGHGSTLPQQSLAARGAYLELLAAVGG